MKTIYNEPIDINFYDMDFPTPIYKYRSWRNDRHKTVITDRKVFLAAPTSFEDKLDCKNHVRYDLLTLGQIFSVYLREAIIKFPKATIEEHHEWAKGKYRGSNLLSGFHLKVMAGEDFEKFDNRIGVLSLTANPKSVPMWKKYSDDHKGFCVGFDPYVLFRFVGGGNIVTYEDELPTIMPRPFDDFMKQIDKQIYHKLRKWDFEEEYRVDKWEEFGHTKETRTKEIPPEGILEIIFGAKMPQSDKEEIISAASSFPRVIFQQATLKESEILIVDYVSTSIVS